MMCQVLLSALQAGSNLVTAGAQPSLPVLGAYSAPVPKLARSWGLLRPGEGLHPSV